MGETLQKTLVNLAIHIVQNYSPGVFKITQILSLAQY